MSSLISIITIIICFLGVFTLDTSVLHANTNTTEPENYNLKTCPIDNTSYVSFTGISDDTYLVDEVLNNEITLLNKTPYVFGGVKIAVAVFDSSSESLPTYWSVLPNEYTLIPNTPLFINPELDLSMISTGEYTVKVFSIQGDEIALLGAIIRDSKYTTGIKINKTSPRKTYTSVSVTVNDQIYKGQTIPFTKRGEPIDVEITTKNENDFPLLGNSMLGVITQGTVPLGTAVQVDKVDLMKLIPDGTRTTKLVDKFTHGGEYTVYAGIISPDTLSPLIAITVGSLDSKHKTNWSYVSKIGLSNYPLKPDSDVVVCLDKVFNDGKNNYLFPETLEINLILNSANGVNFNKKINTNDISSNDFFIFHPQTETSNFILTTNLLQQRFYTEYSKTTEQTNDDLNSKSDNLILVDTIRHTFECTNEKLCDNELSDYSTMNNFINGLQQKPIWFYASITLVGILLLYIILRRILLEKNKKNSFDTE
jgi:hypothetical protein